MQGQTLRVAYEAIPERVGPARRAVTDFALRIGASREDVAAIGLAVTEACANVVMHAYRHRDGPGVVTIVARRRGGQLEVVVGDRGAGLEPRDDSPGLGLGLGIIAEVASELEVGVPDRHDRGLEVRMRFSLG